MRPSNNCVRSGARTSIAPGRIIARCFNLIKLGKFFGIDLYVHGTFWLLPLFIFVSGWMYGLTPAVLAFDLAFIFAIFGCVVLHEVGHALAARGYGIGTRDITLYPVGGVASLERMPEKPGREIAIALAGPAVNVVIAVGLFAGLAAGVLFNPFGLTLTSPGVVEEFASRLMLANVILAVFNMLPAFPMDGGRVLRAVLAIGMPRHRATAAAVTVGSVVAAGFLVFGLTDRVTLDSSRLRWWCSCSVRPSSPRCGRRRRRGSGIVGSTSGWGRPRVRRRCAATREWSGTRRGMWVQYENGNVVRVIDPAG